MTKWIVVGQTFDRVVPVLDCGQGPTEPCADVAEVVADTRADAKVMALRLWRQQRDSNVNHYNDENPFKGMRVFDAEQEADRD